MSNNDISTYSLDRDNSFAPTLLPPSIVKEPSLENIDQQSLENKGNSMRRSTSFKSKPFQRSNGLGCTYYGKNSFYNPREPRKEKLKSPIHKKQTAAMYKTTNKWNPTSYGTVYGKKEQEIRITRKSRLKLNNQLMVDKNRLEELKKLPKILFKNDIRFNPSPISGKKDEYIHYIINNKRKQNNILNARSFKEKIHNKSFIESSRRKEVRTKGMNIDGINFEVHCKCDSSPEDSFDYLRTNIRKDMNLMCYDFNGAANRMASDSPEPREVCREGVRKASLRPMKAAYPNKTTTNFFPGKNDKMRFTMRGQDESTASLYNTKMTEEDKGLSLSDVYENDSENSEEVEVKKEEEIRQCNILSTLASKSNFSTYTRA